MKKCASHPLFKKTATGGRKMAMMRRMTSLPVKLELALVVAGGTAVDAIESRFVWSIPTGWVIGVAPAPTPAEDEAGGAA